jgi:molybdenum cofactor sulfurtransferase
MCTTSNVIDTIGKRVDCLTGWLLENLLSLQHSNGKPMVRIYGPSDTKMRGGTVTLNFYGPDERLLDYRRLEELANAEGISLRTGCFCNPGAGEMAEGLTTEDMMAGFRDKTNMNIGEVTFDIQSCRVIRDGS